MPDYFVTYQKVRELGNLPNLDQGKITPHFPIAKDDVLDIVGQETYDKIFAMTDTYTQDDYDRVQTAEVYFVLKYLIPSLNIESTGAGVTKATGFGDSRKENLSEFELEKLIERYESNAVKILKRYSKTIDQDEDGNDDVLRVQGIGMACISNSESCDED